MRWMVVLAVVVVALAGAGMSDGHLNARAQGNEQLRFSLIQRRAFDPVDYLTWCVDCGGVDYTTGSPWVVNPHDFWPYPDLQAAYVGGPSTSEPGCAWDADDFYQYVSSGDTLPAGASVSVNECRYSSGSVAPSLPTDIRVTSASPDLAVSQTWSWAGGAITATATPVYDRGLHSWVYFDCVYSPPATGSLVTIPNSHDGRAIPQRITVTVRNPTGRKVLKTGAVVESGGLQGRLSGCPDWRNP